MLNRDYSSEKFSSNDFIIREVAGIKFAIGQTKYNTNSEVVPCMPGLEVVLKKEERAEKWHMIGQDHRN